MSFQVPGTSSARRRARRQRSEAVRVDDLKTWAASQNIELITKNELYERFAQVSIFSHPEDSCLITFVDSS